MIVQLEDHSKFTDWYHCQKRRIICPRECLEWENGNEMDTVYMYVQNINQKQIQKRLKNCLKKGKGGESEKKKTQIPNRPTHVSQNPITHVKTPPPENILFFSLILKVHAKWSIKLKVPGNFKIFPLISAIQKVFFPTGFSNEWNWCDFSYSTFLTQKIK